MSFATRAALRTRSGAALAPSALASLRLRAFSAGSVAQKPPMEVVKETLKVVDKVVSSKLLEGIEITGRAAQKVKEVVGLKKAEVKGKADEIKGKVDEIKGKAAEIEGEAKGKASELAGKVEEKEEIKRKVSG